MKGYLAGLSYLGGSTEHAEVLRCLHQVNSIKVGCHKLFVLIVFKQIRTITGNLLERNYTFNCDSKFQRTSGIFIQFLVKFMYSAPSHSKFQQLRMPCCRAWRWWSTPRAPGSSSWATRLKTFQPLSVRWLTSTPENFPHQVHNISATHFFSSTLFSVIIYTLESTCFLLLCVPLMKFNWFSVMTVKMQDSPQPNVVEQVLKGFGFASLP